MGHMIADELVSQVMAQVIGALLAALIAAIGVGGVFWRKLSINSEQDKAISAIKALLVKMACHQLKLSCQRALDRGCISLADFQELQEFYDYYVSIGGNGTGKAIFEKVKKEVHIREDCD